MAIIEIDPRVQAMFDENVAKTRRATDDVAVTLKADQARLSAEAKARDDKFVADRDAATKQVQEQAKAGEPRKPQWERGDRSVGEMAFGPEDPDDAPPPPPPAPVVAPPPPPPARPAARRPAPQDDDDDFGGQTWLR